MRKNSNEKKSFELNPSFHNLLFFKFHDLWTDLRLKFFSLQVAMVTRYRTISRTFPSCCRFPDLPRFSRLLETLQIFNDILEERKQKTRRFCRKKFLIETNIQFPCLSNMHITVKKSLANARMSKAMNHLSLQKIILKRLRQREISKCINKSMWAQEMSYTFMVWSFLRN